MMRKSDGALSEALGIACKDFIESHPDYAFDFLFSASRMTNQGFIDSWAESVAGEFQIDCEGKEKKCIGESLNKSILKCKVDNRNKLAIFYKKVETFCH